MNEEEAERAEETNWNAGMMAYESHWNVGILE
jgi:hypothetical protein